MAPSSATYGTYAVVWRGRDGVSQPGRLTLGRWALRLEGGRGSRSALSIPYAELAGARMARVAERLAGRPTLVLERAGGGLPVSLASVAGAGVLQELHERLIGLAGARGAA